MERIGLFEKYSVGGYFTLSNKHNHGATYFIIDIVIGNFLWHQQNMDTTLKVMEPGISDHALLSLQILVMRLKRKYFFKFPNVVTSTNGFLEAVEANRNQDIRGKPMCIIWRKLKIFQPIIRDMIKPYHGIRRHIEKARDNLSKTLIELMTDRMNVSKTEQVKLWTLNVIKLSNVEENMLRQISKINWIRLGDSNNSYFYASLKRKFSQSHIGFLKDKNGRHLTDQADIEEEVLVFFRDLVGK